MLRAVLDSHQPSEWQAASYSDRTYHLFPVEEDSDEYRAVAMPFTETRPALTLQSLQRVQNPFQLGRLVVRAEQRRHRGEQVTRVTYYHPLDRDDVERALEYNMDVRRYLSRCDRHHSQLKNPVFFSTPGEAMDVISECTNKVILVCHVLEQNSRSRTTTKSFDTEYMPNYVAFVGL